MAKLHIGEESELMDAQKRHITEITRRDLEEIAAAANAFGGDGIDVIPTVNGLSIEIDRDQFTRWVKTIINGGNI